MLKFVVLNYVFCKLYKSFADPHGLNYFEVRAQGNKYAQELLYVVKFADVFITGLFGDDKILQG